MTNTLQQLHLFGIDLSTLSNRLEGNSPVMGMPLEDQLQG